jgi:hypothetical protein
MYGCRVGICLKCSVVVWMFLSAASLAFGKVAFLPTVHLQEGGKPNSIATGDLNGDGKTDVVFTDFNNLNVSVMLGKGDGTFATPVPYTLGDLGTSWPDGVVVGDVNGDGKQDLVVITAANGPNGANAVVLLGNGDGTVQAPLSSPTNISPVTVAAADINGDHKLDLFIGGNGSPAVLFGNGDGSFTIGPDLPPIFSPNVTAEWATGAADLNGDGHTDLFTGNWGAASVAVFLAKADGTFNPPTVYELAGSGVPGSTSAVSADVNGDGKPDILASNYFGNPVGVLIGNGDGTFKDAISYYAGSNPSQIVVLDLDGDGKLDFAASDFNDQNYNPQPDGFGVTAISGKGDGTFDFQTFAQFDAGIQASGIASGDFNGDGLPDLITVNPVTANLSLLINAAQVFFIKLSALSAGSIVPGQSATSTLTISPTNGFGGSVALSCSVSPQPAQAPTCQFSSSSVALTGAPITATLTISTVAGAAAAKHSPGFLWLYAQLLPIGLLFSGITLARSKKIKRGLMSTITFTGALVLLSMQLACGGNSGSSGTGGGSPGGNGAGSTPAGTYTVQVTAKGASLQQQTSLTLTVN